MFGIKMPWTRRKERLAKELAARLAAVAVEAALEKAARIRRLKWEEDVAIANEIAKLPRIPRVAPLAVTGVPRSRTTYLRQGDVQADINTGSYDMLIPATIAILNMSNDVPVACDHQRYAPSYESSCSSYDSGSSDSSSSSSSSYD